MFGGPQVVRRAAVGDVHVRLHAVPGPVERRGGGGGDSRRPARPARHLPGPARPRPSAGTCPAPVGDLMLASWARDADDRPSFADIVQRLQVVYTTRP